MDKLHLLLHMPFPPSCNGLYKNIPKRGGRVRAPTKQYKDWIEKTIPMVDKECIIRGIQCPVKCVYKYGRPDKRRRDVENYIKAVSDMLKRVGILVDDCLIEDVRAYWGDVDGVEITLETIDEI